MSTYRVDVGGVGEDRWSNNALLFGSAEEAEDWGTGLLMRWGGADIFRVVPADHPTGEDIDPNDERIVVSYRS